TICAGLVFPPAPAAAAAERAATDAGAREKLLDLRRAAQEEASRIERELARREDELARRAGVASAADQRVIARAAALDEREHELRAADERRRAREEERKQ